MDGLAAHARARFIRLRRRPRALPADECVSGVCANPEPRYHCFGAQGRTSVFLWRYHGLSPWGSIIKCQGVFMVLCAGSLAPSMKRGEGDCSPLLLSF